MSVYCAKVDLVKISRGFIKCKFWDKNRINILINEKMFTKLSLRSLFVPMLL